MLTCGTLLGTICASKVALEYLRHIKHKEHFTDIRTVGMQTRTIICYFTCCALVVWRHRHMTLGCTPTSDSSKLCTKHLLTSPFELPATNTQYQSKHDTSCISTAFGVLLGQSFCLFQTNVQIRAHVQSLPTLTSAGESSYSVALISDFALQL